MGVLWQVSAAALLGAASAEQNYRGKRNCDVDPKSPEDAGDEKYHSLTFGDEPADLDDELWGAGESRDEFRRLKNMCKEPIDKRKCRKYGLSQWNISSYEALSHLHYREVKGQPLCKEDHQLWEKLKGVSAQACNLQSPVCQMIDGQVRLVGFSGVLSRHNLQFLAKFPYLFSLFVQDVPEDLRALNLPNSLRLLTISSPKDVGSALARLKPLLLKHGQVESLHLHGRQDLRRWPKVDLGELCGLDLKRFSGYTIHAVGDIPECWQKMKNLESFYCTNCMLTKLPTGLQGLTSLKSFVTFRQSEMIPCLVKELNDTVGPCKPAWETYAEIKERLVSTGAYDDFQEGPSWSCKQEAYAFPFKDFMSLGWTNVEKVWLDGNFLTGEIPEEIADVWPNLQSLDLYGNQMHGEVPHSLTKLDFVKLQLNGNDFSGDFPKEFAERVHKGGMMLGVASNPKLKGCMHTESGIGATQLRRCAKDEL